MLALTIMLALVLLLRFVHVPRAAEPLLSLPEPHVSKLYSAPSPGWRNGRRGGLKIRGPTRA